MVPESREQVRVLVAKNGVFLEAEIKIENEPPFGTVFEMTGKEINPDDLSHMGSNLYMGSGQFMRGNNLESLESSNAIDDAKKRGADYLHIGDSRSFKSVN